MVLNAFIYGIIFAFGLIIPLGPQNLFVFNQGANQKHFYHVLPVILTASLCDTLLIVLAVSGVSILVFKFIWIKIIIYIIGLIFLAVITRSVWVAKPLQHTNTKAISAKKQILFALSVSLFNPHAIMDTIVVIGTNALNFAGNARIAYTIACILVSFIWFFFLAILGRIIGKADTSGKLLMRINKISAIILATVFLYIAYQLLLTIKQFA